MNRKELFKRLGQTAVGTLGFRLANSQKFLSNQTRDKKVAFESRRRNITDFQNRNDRLFDDEWYFFMGMPRDFMTRWFQTRYHSTKRKATAKGAKPAVINVDVTPK